MSQENVELVEELYEHFNRTGQPPWDLFDPEAVLDASNVPGLGVIRGRENALAAISDYAAVFDDWRIEPEEIIDAGDLVVAVVRDGGRVKGTSDEIFNRFTHVWVMRGGKVVSWKTFTDRAKGFKAAGLSE